jgi:hypothetical protein
MAEKVYGPKSYFPSIEKKYGQPIPHWKAILETSGLQKHMEMVNLLETSHGMGHGHATRSSVIFVRSEDSKSPR